MWCLKYYYIISRISGVLSYADILIVAGFQPWSSIISSRCSITQPCDEPCSSAESQDRATVELRKKNKPQESQKCSIKNRSQSIDCNGINQKVKNSETEFLNGDTAVENVPNEERREHIYQLKLGVAEHCQNSGKVMFSLVYHFSLKFLMMIQKNLEAVLSDVIDDESEHMNQDIAAIAREIDQAYIYISYKNTLFPEK